MPKFAHWEVGVFEVFYDVGIEYIEGAARARHKNQAKDNSGHANAQQDKVHAVKGENSFLFHIFWLFD